jgi:predicted trehalose synthase
MADTWNAMISLLSQNGHGIPALLTNARLAGIDDGLAVIRFAPQNEHCIKMLERNGKKDLVRDALSKVLDQAVGVRFEISDAVVAPVPASVASAPVQPAKKSTPAAAPSPQPVPAESSNSVRVTEEKRAELYKTVPLVKAVVDQLGGSVIRLETDPA